jgi:hypothetical protein
MRTTCSGVAQIFSRVIPARTPTAAAALVDRVGRDEVLVGGVGEDHRQQVDQAGDGAGGVALGEGLRPQGDVERGDRGERRGAEAGQEVAAQPAAVALERALVQVEGGQPTHDPHGKRDAARDRVDPGAASPVSGHVGDIGQGVAFAAEPADRVGVPFRVPAHPPGLLP